MLWSCLAAGELHWHQAVTSRPRHYIAAHLCQCAGCVSFSIAVYPLALFALIYYSCPLAFFGSASVKENLFIRSSVSVVFTQPRGLTNSSTLLLIELLQDKLRGAEASKRFTFVSCEPKKYGKDNMG